MAILATVWSIALASEQSSTNSPRDNIKLVTLDSSDSPILLAQAGDITETQAILFIHGSPGRWDAFEDYLSDPALTEHALLISYDRPGWGLSNIAEESAGKFAEQSAAAIRIMATYPHKRWILVGHSLGASIAPQIMLDASEQGHTVDALILLAGSLSPELGKARWYNHVANTLLGRLVLGTSLRQSNREIMRLRDELIALADRLQGESLVTSVTILQGRQDKLVAPENADYAQQHWPSVFRQLNIEVIEDAGHFLPWRNRQQVMTTILSQLRPHP